MCVYYLGWQKQNRSTAQVIEQYIMFKSKFVPHKDKGLLSLTHYTEFVQTVSKGVGITSTFYSIQYLQVGRGVR